MIVKNVKTRQAPANLLLLALAYHPHLGSGGPLAQEIVVDQRNDLLV